MKMIGINPATGQLRWPVGSPYRLRLRIRDAAGAALPLTGRDLAMTIYRGTLVFSSVAGTIATDVAGEYATFAFPGTVFADAGQYQVGWELAELFEDGKTPLLTGAVFVVATAPSGAGDGDYVPDGQFDDLSWSPATDSLIVVLNGPVGPRGPAGNDALITRTAAEALGGHRGVRLDDAGDARLADPTDAHAVATMGITVGAAESGALVDIRASGEMYEPSWAWVAGPVWLGPGGILTQTLPTSGLLIRMGIAAGPARLTVQPQLIAKI